MRVVLDFFLLCRGVGARELERVSNDDDGHISVVGLGVDWKMVKISNEILGRE